GAVELGYHQTSESNGGIKSLHLCNGVLSGVAVHHQKHLLGSRAVRLTDDPLDLLQLFHQVQLRGQPAGRVHHHHTGLASTPCVHGIKATAAGSPPSCAMTVTSLRLPHS